MINNILITGGAGFIGYNLAFSLVSSGHKVTVLDNLSPQIHADPTSAYETLKDHVRFIRGDVCSSEDWATALEGQDAVVHLAAETGTGQSMYEIERYVKVNIKGTALLLDILAERRHSIKKLVLASSRAVYGEGRYECQLCGIVYPDGRCQSDMFAGDFAVKCPSCAGLVAVQATDELSKVNPTSIYGITKLNQEQMMLLIGKSLRIPTFALRFQNVYGPGQSLSNPYTGILSIFSTRIKNGHEIVIFEDGEESRDFIFIDDVVNASIAALKSKLDGQHIINIGSGVPISVMTVAQSLKMAFGAKVDIRVSGNFRLGDIRHNFADISKSRKMLNFEPKTFFQEGIFAFANWVDLQNISTDFYEKSICELKNNGLYK